MVGFHFPRKDHQRRLPHSRAFEASIQQSSQGSDSHSSSDSGSTTCPGAPDLDAYTNTMRRWTLCQLRVSVAIPPYSGNPNNRHHSFSVTSVPNYTPTTTLVSPLYPTNSSLYECSIKTPDCGDEGNGFTTPCNTPRDRGLRRRSTVVAAARKKVRDEVRDEREGQAGLRPVELIRSLSCNA